MSSLEQSMLEVMTSMWDCTERMICEHTCYIWLALPFLWIRVPLMWMLSTYDTSRTLSESMSTTGGLFVWSTCSLSYQKAIGGDEVDDRQHHITDGNINWSFSVCVSFSLYFCNALIDDLFVFQHFSDLDSPTLHTHFWLVMCTDIY